MITPPEEFYTESPRETLMILFRIISRKSWNELQSWHDAFPGSRVEHILYGVYVLIIEPGGARRLAS
jgi:hypothetical protein